jgi:DNA-binding transcriptional LysR family regulator
MDLRSLRHVVALARRLSYRKAAEDLGLTQSALSRSIQAVERRANVRLFDRDRGGVHLTSVGRAFAERAAGLLREADELDRLLDRASAGAQGEIAFGLAPLLAAALAPGALGEALASAPDLRAHVLVRDAGALLQLLLGERIEFLVSSEPLMPAGAPLKSTVLGHFPTSLLVRSGHPLLSEAAPGEARQFPLIAAAPFEGLELGAGPLGFLRPAPQLVVEDHTALLRIVETSDAVWLSSSFAVADEIIAGRIKPLVVPGWQEAGFRIVMYSLDRRSLSPAALRLRQQFQARIRRLHETMAEAAARTPATAALPRPGARSARPSRAAAGGSAD